MIVLFVKKLLRFTKKRFSYLARVSTNLYMALFRYLFNRKKINNCTVYYIDAGLHVKGEQLAEVIGWLSSKKNVVFIGFEANPKHAIEAKKAFSQYPQVLVENYALVGPAFESGEVSFYVDRYGRGLGDTTSKKRAQQRRMEEISVPAIRLTTYLKNLGADPCQDTILLRMNIEGSELDVLKDLEHESWIDKIQGYYGSWSDVYKISDQDGRILEKMKADYNIKNITFNSGEIKNGHNSLVLKSIKLHIKSIVRHCT